MVPDGAVQQTVTWAVLVLSVAVTPVGANGAMPMV